MDTRRSIRERVIFFNGREWERYAKYSVQRLSGAPDIRNVLAWFGEEAPETGCGGDRGANGEGILNVWDTANGISFVQVPGKKFVFLR